ncbi:MAG: hypothetical protein V2I46_14480 [Bacteroides sp.]|jgi:hypothetical protein|nr:hypothetical protein [Bacteroides sp.]
MPTLNDHIGEYKKQMDKGSIKLAYRGLLKYLMGLRLYFKGKYPDFFVSGSLFLGTMDMTYFSFTHPLLKQKDLKIAIVFLHEQLRFEVWLAAVNKEVQNQYRKFFKEKGWDKYPLTDPGKGMDAIFKHTLVNKPDFNDLSALTGQIEKESLEFIQGIISFIS